MLQFCQSLGPLIYRGSTVIGFYLYEAYYKQPSAILSPCALSFFLGRANNIVLLLADVQCELPFSGGSSPSCLPGKQIILLI